MVEYQIVPSKTALLVIDVQKGYFGGPFACPSAPKIVPVLKRLIEFCRSRKIPVIYTTHMFRKDLSNAGRYKDIFPGALVLREGVEEVEVYDEITPREEEVVIKKCRYSAFYGTDLDAVLKGLGVDTVVISGLVTDACPDSTARDAFYRDYKVVFLSDGTGARTDEAQAATLKAQGRLFSQVMDSEQFMARIQKAQAS